jgi:glycosyltransferase involved in cell wall biosynthesis
MQKGEFDSSESPAIAGEDERETIQLSSESIQRRDLAALATESGLHGVRMVAWRDLDDPEAGGSELHAHRLASQWAACGLKVTLRTSAVPDEPELVRRNGYLAVRRSGRYLVFPRVALEGLRTGVSPGECLVEIWNGMPFLSPLWSRGPRVAFLHHVHAEMWEMALPHWIARMGSALERYGAPPLYHSTRIVTLSESSRDEIVELLHIPGEHITVAAPGIEGDFTPADAVRSATPLVVAVGRLVPVKRFDRLFTELELVRRRVPDLQCVVIGEGHERANLEALRRSMGAESWIALPGRVPRDELVSWYRRAWVVASSSLREGWGMTLTEAAACGTPAVATDIAGHRDAVSDGVSGLLAGAGVGVLAALLSAVLSDAALRSSLAKGALDRARWFSWERTARITLEALAVEVQRHAAPHRASATRRALTPLRAANSWRSPHKSGAGMQTTHGTKGPMTLAPALPILGASGPQVLLRTIKPRNSLTASVRSTPRGTLSSRGQPLRRIRPDRRITHTQTVWSTDGAASRSLRAAARCRE